MTKRVRYRGKQNTHCKNCGAFINYTSPTAYSRQRCDECAKVRSVAKNLVDQRRSRIKAILHASALQSLKGLPK
jgi:hypothetical protein